MRVKCDKCGSTNLYLEKTPFGRIDCLDCGNEMRKQPQPKPKDKVYLVETYVRHEGSEIAGCFKNKENATKLKNDIDSLRERIKNIEDKFGDGWDKYQELEDELEKLGGDEYDDGCDITEIELGD